MRRVHRPTAGYRWRSVAIGGGMDGLVARHLAGDQVAGADIAHRAGVGRARALRARLAVGAAGITFAGIAEPLSLLNHRRMRQSSTSVLHRRGIKQG